MWWFFSFALSWNLSSHLLRLMLLNFAVMYLAFLNYFSTYNEWSFLFLCRKFDNKIIGSAAVTIMFYSREDLKAHLEGVTDCNSLISFINFVKVRYIERCVEDFPISYFTHSFRQMMDSWYFKGLVLLENVSFEISIINNTKLTTTENHQSKSQFNTIRETLNGE